MEAVLADIRNRGVATVLNLGDCLYGPLDPAGTAQVLIDLDIPTVRGNQDRLTTDRAVAAGTSPTMTFVRDQLSRPQLDWLDRLPMTLPLEAGLLLCHGTPARDDEYLLQVVTPEGARQRTTEELAAKLTGVDQPVILCGHDHSPGTVTLPTGQQIVNPGSVGLQAFTDDQPHPYAMATGSPRARYAILTRTTGGWEVEAVSVAYDHEQAAATAEQNGRRDWAAWLRTGIA